ncbi:RHS repeat-associated core domain-containing protein [Vulcaniibacterium tengchongense]|uniref:RHS repeat-associated protein n=1 Tax=Vulcaniibacterium tengchongense TaxID=1273429 RepID=A0A3N4VTC2_9GAMM|nr:RHS repeat-associated core domain-containing protein [Vulcaniibacterium tengchongense]RPE77060.1 RHS repeat-associated protein [Vulcaniibacterium tengchongense]
MTVAAKHFDPQLGIDIHTYLIPPSPIPIPLPTPHIGIVLDPFDYVPVIGGTVHVNGVKRATAGCMGLDVHIPVGGVWMPTLKMPLGPQWDDELFMGSRTVLADGDPFSRVAMPVLACNLVGMVAPFRPRKPKRPKLSLLLPTTVNLAIPTNVYVGGAPTVSWSALAMRAGLAGLGRLARKSGVAGRAADAFRRLRQKLFKNLPPGFLKCNVLRAEPVDIRDGSVVVAHEDFAVPGRLPLAWSRHYRSSRHAEAGRCGAGWRTPADVSLALEADGSVWFEDVESAALFPQLPQGEGDAHAVRELVDGARLAREGDWLWVRTKEGLRYGFEVGAAPVRLPHRWPLRQVEDLCGNHWRYEWRDGHLVRIVESGTADEAGRPLQGRFIEVDSRQGRIERMALHDPATGLSHPLVRYEYDAAGDLAAAVDPLEAARRFVYVGHRLVRHTDRVGLSFHYEYDARGRVVRSWGDGGLYAYTFRYDETLRETEVTDSLGHASLVKFDEHGLPLCEIDPLEGVTVFEYDEVGRTVAVTDPLGHRTAFEYDARGNLLKLVRADGSAVRQVFDEDDRLVERIDATGAAERFEWGEHRLLAAAIVPSGGAYRFAYTAHGQLCEVADPRGGVGRLGYDRYGKPNLLVDPLGLRIVMENDCLGRTLRRRVGEAGATEFAYDAKGRLLRVTQANGRQIACEYDGEGRPIRHCDESGAITRLQYVGLDLLAKRILPDGTATEYRYDTEGRLSAVVNPNGEEYRLLRDARGDVIEEIDYWGQSRRYERDAAGRIRRRIDALGRSVEYELDRMGRVVRKRMADPFEAGRTRLETFRYDAEGRLVEARNAVAHVRRRYDVDGRVVHEELNGFAVASAYDAAGHRTSRTSDAGNRVGFRYDALGRLDAVVANDQPAIDVWRNLHGQTVLEQWGAALAHAYRYDDAGRVAVQALLQDDAELLRTEYDHDEVGDLVERRDSEYGRDRYRYDAARRVVEHAGPIEGVRDRSTDRAGNRLATRVVRNERKRVVGGDPQPDDGWSREGDLEGVHYAFDRAGNLSRRRLDQVPGRPEMQLLWDAEQRLVECRWTSGERKGAAIRFGYDPLGRRVFKRGPRQTTWFFWDGDALLGEVTAANDDADDALWTGGVADLVEAQRRRRRAKALHGRVREYVYRPGSHEPLLLIEPDAPAAPAPAAPAPTRPPQEQPKPPSARPSPATATPMRPAAGPSLAAQASPGAAARTSPPNEPAQGAGLGFGVRLGGQGAGAASADESSAKATLPDARSPGLGGRLDGTRLGGESSALRSAGTLPCASSGAAAGGAISDAMERESPAAEDAPAPASAVAGDASVAIRPEPAVPSRAVYYFYNDLNGCPIRIVDGTGQVVWGATHSPTGQALALEAQRRIENPLRHQGQYYDRETGLSYNLARYYDAHAGCYVSADPLGLEAGENTYLYAFGNPFLWADPWGLNACRRGEWIFPEGGSRNVNDYQTIYTNGIMGNRAAAVALVERQRVAYYYNPSFSDGLPTWLPGFIRNGLGGAGDVLETAVQKFGRGRDPLTSGFVDGLRQLDHPVTIVGHSQGAATVVRAAPYIPRGSTVVLRSPAVSYNTAAQAFADRGVDWKYVQPVGDIAPLYASNDAGQWLSQVRKISPNLKKTFGIHNQNGLHLGTGDFPGPTFPNG